jgi:hypothetical protein
MDPGRPSSNSQFVEFLERCAAAAADDGGAIAADERVINLFLASGAIKRSAFGVLDLGHQILLSRRAVI